MWCSMKRVNVEHTKNWVVPMTKVIREGHLNNLLVQEGTRLQMHLKWLSTVVKVKVCQCPILFICFVKS